MTSHESLPDTTARIPVTRARPRSPGRDDGHRDAAATGVAAGPGAGVEADGGDVGSTGGGRRSGRVAGRRIVRRVVKTVAALVVLLAFLLLGDRWAVLYAENMVAGELKDALKLHAEPEVHIGGFPFLAQLATGHVDDVEVNVPHVPAGPVSVAQVKGTVDDVRIVGFPTSVKGAELSGVRGDVFLDFDDLNREVGASRVHLVAGHQRNTVLAHGEMTVAGNHAHLEGRAHVRRTGDRGLAMTVADTKLVVPGLLSYVPGEGGGLRLAAPAAGRVDEQELRQATGQPVRPDQMMGGRVLDALAEHPAVLAPAGIDPSLIRGLQKVSEPKVAKPMQFSAQLPDDVPEDIRLADISVTKTGIRAHLTGTTVPVSG